MNTNVAYLPFIMPVYLILFLYSQYILSFPYLRLSSLLPDKRHRMNSMLLNHNSISFPDCFPHFLFCRYSPADLRHILGEPGFGVHTKCFDGSWKLRPSTLRIWLMTPCCPCISRNPRWHPGWLLKCTKYPFVHRTLYFFYLLELRKDLIVEHSLYQAILYIYHSLFA